MRKIYATPALVAMGTATGETKGSFANQEIGGTGLTVAPGTVGFYL